MALVSAPKSDGITQAWAAFYKELAVHPIRHDEHGQRTCAIAAAQARERFFTQLAAKHGMTRLKASHPKHFTGPT